MKPLRIAFISPFYPFKGGIAKFSSLLLEALRTKGYDVLPVSFKALYPRFLIGAPLEGDQSTGKASITRPGLVLYNPFSWFRTARFIRSLQPDVVLVAYWSGFLAPLYLLLRRMTGVRTVVLLHNYAAHESFFFEPLMKMLLAACTDAFITLSGAVSRELEADLPEVPRLQLYHPVYEPAGKSVSSAEARKELGIGPDVPVLLFFGYVRRYKGLDLLLQAMPAILKKEPSLKLVVAGHFFEQPARYRELVRQLDIAGNVDIYPGYVPSERTGAFFAAADAVVLPYRSATQSGVVQLAYGYGLPVIATPVGSLPDMIRPGKSGWIAGDVSPERIAEAVSQYLDSRGRLDAQRAEILSISRECSWEAFSEAAGRFLEAEAGRR
ncbi:MAG: glycosyltransferase [Chlorobiaceae bacterium]|nr:glycosyltransferase [Chlorobiaceae bacterium]